MATMRISKRAVDAAEPGSKDKYLWDDDLTGFGVKITPAGAKTYLIQYRIGGRKGRTRRFTLGRHGIVTADHARTEARRLLGEVAAGRDPASQRDRSRATPTFGAALEDFFNHHVATKLKASTAAGYRSLARLYLPKPLLSQLVVDTGRPEITRLHTALQDTPYQANRVLALLSKFFNWAEKQGLRPDGSNPCRHIEKYRERKRERFLSQEEFTRLGEALAKAEREKLASPWVIAAIRLLVLTGARLTEIRALRWDEVDLERRALRLRDSKTGEKTIHLSDAAIQILENLRRLSNNPYVICGNKEGACLVNLQKPWRRIRSLAGLQDVRIHDLRHSFASVAAAQGLSLPVIGALLGHSQPATTARYAHLASDPVAEASALVSRQISIALGHLGGGSE